MNDIILKNLFILPSKAWDIPTHTTQGT